MCFKEDIIGKGYNYQDRAHTFQRSEGQGVTDAIQAMGGLHIVDEPGSLEYTCFDRDIVNQSYNQQVVQYNPFQHKDQQRTSIEQELDNCLHLRDDSRHLKIQSCNNERSCQDQLEL